MATMRFMAAFAPGFGIMSIQAKCIKEGGRGEGEREGERTKDVL